MLLKKISPLFLILLIYSCAGIVAPTGGPKDDSAPKVKKVIPEDKTTHFNTSSIVFQFDEYVVLNDINNQFIMSPPQEQAPEINLKGKKVEVKFKEPLLANTTYTINFGNGIKDNNEGNILQGLSYTFSTGDFIDSLSLSGSVKDGFTLLPSADAAIGLYIIQDDSTIFKNKPSYMVKPNESGSFTFNYLRPGTYQLVAFEDINRNLKIESTEKLAFYSELINLSYSVKDSNIYNLLLSPQQFDRSKPQLITVKEQVKGEYVIITSGSKCNLVVNGYDFGYRRKVPSLLYKPSVNCDTAYYFTTDSCYDSLILQVKIDTATETYISRCKQKKYKPFELTSGTIYTGFDFYDSLRLEFSNPVMDADTTYIKFFEDTLLKTNYRLEYDTQNPKLLYFVYPWQEDKMYSIKIGKYAFADLFRQQNDSLSITINTAAGATLGSLSINVTAPKTGNFIVQLLDAKSAVVNQRVISSAASITYRNLQPGQYFVKVINDVNQNGIWDGANYFKKQQPEPVYITPQSTEVRANWDVTDIVIDPGF